MNETLSQKHLLVLNCYLNYIILANWHGFSGSHYRLYIKISWGALKIVPVSAPKLSVKTEWWSKCPGWIHWSSRKHKVDIKVVWKCLMNWFACFLFEAIHVEGFHKLFYFPNIFMFSNSSRSEKCTTTTATNTNSNSNDNNTPDNPFWTFYTIGLEDILTLYGLLVSLVLSKLV